MEVSAEEDYEEKLLELEAEDSFVETPMSPSSEGDPQSVTEHSSVWDSDTPSSVSYPAVTAEQTVEIQSVGKRTVIRQGKQVVFRDEDGTGDDEDIMVDSGRWPGCREVAWEVMGRVQALVLLPVEHEQNTKVH